MLQNNRPKKETKVSLLAIGTKDNVTGCPDHTSEDSGKLKFKYTMSKTDLKVVLVLSPLGRSSVPTLSIYQNHLRVMESHGLP